ncbi:MAG: 30S ribosomal protein S9 [Candidatus Eremiobacteraeota bacterium]|nr:30S ribosomal protein S9 [Candidatus Eremiobacteraeota bacterium]
MSKKYFQGTGRRKTAIARVFLAPGKGNFTVNKRPADEYFMGRMVWNNTIKEPLVLTDTLGKFDIMVNAKGGGISSQADAIRHGIARALLDYDESLRSVLKKAGCLRRDPRMKERKKYGRKRARKGFQWTKR